MTSKDKLESFQDVEAAVADVRFKLDENKEQCGKLGKEMEQVNKYVHNELMKMMDLLDALKKEVKKDLKKEMTKYLKDEQVFERLDALEEGGGVDVTEIKKEIERRAAAEGYSFVFDSSGRTLNEQPAVLFFPAGCDLTEAVIRELNRGRSGGPEAPAATEPVSSAVSQPSGLPASSGVPQEPNPQSGEDR